MWLFSPTEQTSERAGRDQGFKLINSYLLSLCFLNDFIPFLVSPSPRHTRRCEFNDSGGGDNDHHTSDTHQHVYNTRERCIRSRPRPRVRPFPHSARPSTTPVRKQHYPMATVHNGPSTFRVCTIHVCFPRSPSNSIRQPLCYTNSVPLDYAKPAAGTIQIAMIRYPAQRLPRQGSMFMNPGSHLRDLSCASCLLILLFPGGPGVSGVNWMTDSAPAFQSIVGRDWDVLSFDPREFHPYPILNSTYLTYRAMQAVSVFPDRYLSSLLLRMRRQPFGAVS